MPRGHEYVVGRNRYFEHASVSSRLNSSRRRESDLHSCHFAIQIDLNTVKSIIDISRAAAVYTEVLRQQRRRLIEIL